MSTTCEACHPRSVKQQLGMTAGTTTGQRWQKPSTAAIAQPFQHSGMAGTALRTTWRSGLSPCLTGNLWETTYQWWIFHCQATRGLVSSTMFPTQKTMLSTTMKQPLSLWIVNDQPSLCHNFGGWSGWHPDPKQVEQTRPLLFDVSGAATFCLIIIDQSEHEWWWNIRFLKNILKRHTLRAFIPHQPRLAVFLYRSVFHKFTWDVNLPQSAGLPDSQGEGAWRRAIPRVAPGRWWNERIEKTLAQNCRDVLVDLHMMQHHTTPYKICIYIIARRFVHVQWHSVLVTCAYLCVIPVQPTMIWCFFRLWLNQAIQPGQALGSKQHRWHLLGIRKSPGKMTWFVCIGGWWLRPHYFLGFLPCEVPIALLVHLCFALRYPATTPGRAHSGEGGATADLGSVHSQDQRPGPKQRIPKDRMKPSRVVHQIPRISTVLKLFSAWQLIETPVRHVMTLIYRCRCEWLGYEHTRPNIVT